MLMALSFLLAVEATLHASTCSRRTFIFGTTSAALSGQRALALDPALLDEKGSFVVDPLRASRGLEDAYSTIGAALAVAPTGSTILVRPGMYQERVLIKDGVTLLADRGATLMWKSDRPYEAALTIDLSSSSQPSTIVVSGLAIRHSSPSIAQNYAVYVPQPSTLADANSRIELRGCDVSSASGSGVGVEGGSVSIESCEIHDCKNHGVLYLGQTARGSVRKSTVSNCKLNVRVLPAIELSNSGPV